MWKYIFAPIYRSIQSTLLQRFYERTEATDMKRGAILGENIRPRPRLWPRLLHLTCRPNMQGFQDLWYWLRNTIHAWNACEFFKQSFHTTFLFFPDDVGYHKELEFCKQ